MNKPVRRCATCSNMAGRVERQCGRCRREKRSLPSGHVQLPPKKSSEGVLFCPKCHARMVRRRNGKDGSLFWGCSNYPDCRGTRPFEARVEVLPKLSPPKWAFSHFEFGRAVYADSLDLDAAGRCVKCGEDAPKRFDGLCAGCFSRLLA